MNTSHAQTQQPATKPAHTPLPWHIGVRQVGPHVYGPHGAQVADCNLATNFDGENKANAALIVRAVNSHAELVAALEAAMLELEANKVAMIGPEWASQRTMTGGALAKCARALHNAKANEGQS